MSMIDQLRETHPHIDWREFDAPADTRDMVSGYSCTQVVGRFGGLYRVVVSEESTCFSVSYTAQLEWATGVLLGSIRDNLPAAMENLLSLVDTLNQNLQPKAPGESHG